MVSAEAVTTAPQPIHRFVLAWLDWKSDMDRSVVFGLRRRIEDVVDAPREQVEIDLWLESGGGDAHSAYKLALMLQHASAHIRVVIPDFAKSAATLLSLVGDEIYMAPGADLGPLDAQVPEEGSLAGAISALNIARAADELAREAVDLAIEGGKKIVSDMRLSRADTLNAMLDFSAKFSEPLVRQLDPRIVSEANDLLRITVRYAERLLRDKTAPGRARTIAHSLVEAFPSHGFVISREDAEGLGLPVRPIETYDLLDLVRQYHRASETGERLLMFGPIEDFLPEDEEEEEEEEDYEQPPDEEEPDGPEEPAQSASARRSGNGAAEVDAREVPSRVPGE